MIGPQWHKSSHSNSNANCVEVRGRDKTIQVRDSKNPDGPVLAFGPGDWAAFLSDVERGEFSLSD